LRGSYFSAIVITMIETENKDTQDISPKLYELGYLLLPQIAESEVGNAVLELKQEVEKRGGTIMEEGEVGMRALAYTVSTVEEHKRKDHNNAYFGWFKFTLLPANAEDLRLGLVATRNVIRSLIMKTDPTPAPRILSVRKATIDTLPLVESITKKEKEVGEPLTDNAVAELDKEIEQMLA